MVGAIQPRELQGMDGKVQALLVGHIQGETMKVESREPGGGDGRRENGAGFECRGR